jgi:hypothetical protein
LEGFKGTDHLVVITYEVNEWQGKVYHNLKSFTVQDVPQGATTPPPQTTAPMPTAGDIPFGR